MSSAVTCQPSAVRDTDVTVETFSRNTDNARIELSMTCAIDKGPGADAGCLSIDDDELMTGAGSTNSGAASATIGARSARAGGVVTTGGTGPLGGTRSNDGGTARTAYDSASTTGDIRSILAGAGFTGGATDNDAVASACFCSRQRMTASRFSSS